MEIVKKITPTCVKENIERKKLKSFQQEPNNPSPVPQPTQSAPIQQPINDPPVLTEPIQIAPAEPQPILNAPLINPINNQAGIIFDRCLARELKRLLFGRDGELSLLLSFVYQLSVLRELNAPLKDLLERILPIQFEIYKNLSDAVDLFGGNPTLTDGRGNVWTGRNIESTNNPRTFVERTINILENQIESYNRLLLETGNQGFNTLISSISIQKQNQITKMKNILT